MTRMSSKTKTLIVVVSALAFAVIMLGAYYLFIKPASGKIDSDGAKAVTIQIEYKSETFTYNVKTDKTNLFELMSENNDVCDLSFEYSGGETDAFITSLKNVPSDDKSFYLLYVNEQFAMQGISLTPVNNGDIFKFVYMTNLDYNEDWSIKSYDLGGKLFPHQITLIVFMSLVCAILAAAIVITVIYFVLKIKKGNNDDKNNG